MSFYIHGHKDYFTLNESPSEKEGKCRAGRLGRGACQPSMKVPPKRKGNTGDAGLVSMNSYPQ